MCAYRGALVRQRLEVLLEGYETYEPQSVTSRVIDAPRPVRLVVPAAPLNSEAIVLRDFNSNLVGEWWL